MSIIKSDPELDSVQHDSGAAVPREFPCHVVGYLTADAVSNRLSILPAPMAPQPLVKQPAQFLKKNLRACICPGIL